MLRNFLLVTLISVGPAAKVFAAECFWRPGQNKVGIVCGDASEFSYMVISCEGEPLHLWIDENCGGERKCNSGLLIDGEKSGLGIAIYIDDGYAGVSIPLKDKMRVLSRLARAKTLKALVGGKVSPELPTAGLSEGIRTILSTCH